MSKPFDCEYIEEVRSLLEAYMKKYEVPLTEVAFELDTPYQNVQRFLNGRMHLFGGKLDAVVEMLRSKGYMVKELATAAGKRAREQML